MEDRLPNVCVIGTGEYSTGWVSTGDPASDKGCGVVGLVCFDMRRRGLLGPRIALVGTNGSKFPMIRQHFDSKIRSVYKDMDTSFDSFPADDVQRDPAAYVTALASFQPGDIAMIFTPDDTHFPICMEAIKRGLHILVTKPAVQTLEQHIQLQEAASAAGVLVCSEMHKRWDPMYNDARQRARKLGPFGFFQSYMSQPKKQLDTFKSWLSTMSSDISYYLNAHHIDFSVWTLQSIAFPEKVTAFASAGVATSKPYELPSGTLDTITLVTEWRNLPQGEAEAVEVSGGAPGHAIYTSSWSASKSDVHSQQRFHYMGHQGELQIDQAHRGYSQAHDASGFAQVNPLFLRYAPDDDGYFAGQGCYSYLSFENFVRAVHDIRSGRYTANQIDEAPGGRNLATLGTTLDVTAILDAGAKSIGAGGKAVKIVREKNKPIGLEIM